jgi:hypothetical protein
VTKRFGVVAALVAVVGCGGGADGGGTQPTPTPTPTTPAPTPTIGISLGNSTAVLAAGQSATILVTVSRTAFTGTIDLSLEGAPAGVTGTFSPSSLTAATATSALALTSGSAPTAGTSTLTVRARGTGVTDVTGTIALTVLPPPPPANLTLTFCTAPLWLAAQDNTGPWFRSTPTGNAFRVGIAARGGVAYVTGSASDGYTLTVIYGTMAEIGAQFATCTSNTGTKSMSGTIAGVSSGSTASVALGSRHVDVAANQTAFTISNVADGALDLLAVQKSPGRAGLTVSATTSKVIIRRALNLASGATLPVLDFGAAEALAPATATLTITGLGAGQATLDMTYITSTSEISLTDSLSAVATQQISGVPASAQAATDLHWYTVDEFSFNTGTERIAAKFAKTFVDRTIALGSLLTPPTVDVVARTPYLRTRVQLPVQSEYTTLGEALYLQGFIVTGPNTRTVDIQATRAYLGTATAWDLSVPDLSTGAFDPTWGMRSGNSTFWFALGLGGATYDQLLGDATDGLGFTYAIRFDSLRAASTSLIPSGPVFNAAPMGVTPSPAQVRAAFRRHFARIPLTLLGGAGAPRRARRETEVPLARR